MNTESPLESLIVEIAKLRAENAELTKGVAAMGAMQFLIFRFLMQYDHKLASAIAGGISREIDRPLPPDFAGGQLYKDYIRALFDIASDPEQRDEKGRPTWIRLVTDVEPQSP